MAKLSVGKRLKNFFNIDVKKSDNDFTGDKVIVPTETVEKEGKTFTRKVNLPESISRLWKWYVDQTNDTNETLKNRMDRYKDLDYMVYNDTVISMAADLYADEASQADIQIEPVQVDAKKTQVRNTIKSLLQQWGINQSYIRETAWNIAVYGDSFDINVFDKNEGITDIVPQDVRTILDRIEFNAAEISKKMSGTEMKFVNREPRLQSLVKELEKTDSESYSSYFKSYLLGFQLQGGLFLPPWAVNHYRNFSKKSEFWPFGRSMFIYSIGPFRQLKTAKNLMALTRALKFPKDVYEVEVSENMTEVEKWEAVNDARQEFHNFGVINQNKDDFSVGGELWIPNGLINHTSIESNLRIEDIADIELLRDDMIMGTRIPKGYLVVDRSSFGTSGQSLLQQFKPFGRAVFHIQSVILEQLTKVIKMHFLATDQFDKEMTEFQLSLNFPVVEEAQDRLRMKQDTLRLANDVISNIQSALGTRDGLPPDVVEMIFSKLSFLEPEDVKEIMKKTVSGLGLDKDDPEDKGGDGFDMFSSVERNKLTDEKVRNRINEEIIYDSYFDAVAKNNFTEGVLNSRHYVTSTNQTQEQDQLFSLLRRDGSQELNE